MIKAEFTSAKTDLLLTALKLTMSKVRSMESSAAFVTTKYITAVPTIALKSGTPGVMLILAKSISTNSALKANIGRTSKVTAIQSAVLANIDHFCRHFTHMGTVLEMAHVFYVHAANYSYVSTKSLLTIESQTANTNASHVHPHSTS